MDFKEKLVSTIITELQLEDVEVSDVNFDEPLFGDEGLGLDSLDAVELVVIIKKYYGVQIANMAKGQEVFESINSLTVFIEDETK